MIYILHILLEDADVRRDEARREVSYGYISE